jgi:hypothetical protein
MSLVEELRNRATALAGIVAAVAAIMGTAVTVENRYARAADVETLRQETHEQFRDARRQDIEDRLFELRLKTRPTQIDRAMIQRLEDQLRALDQPQNPR